MYFLLFVKLIAHYNEAKFIIGDKITKFNIRCKISTTTMQGDTFYSILFCGV